MLTAKMVVRMNGVKWITVKMASGPGLNRLLFVNFGTQETDFTFAHDIGKR